MKDLKKASHDKGTKIANPIPYEKRLFKCVRCKEHYYMTKLAEHDTCRECYERKISKTDDQASNDSLGDVRQASACSSYSFGSSPENNADQ